MRRPPAGDATGHGQWHDQVEPIPVSQPGAADGVVKLQHAGDYAQDRSLLRENDYWISLIAQKRCA
jgi:hypothetical protein